MFYLPQIDVLYIKNKVYKCRCKQSVILIYYRCPSNGNKFYTGAKTKWIFLVLRRQRTRKEVLFIVLVIILYILSKDDNDGNNSSKKKK